MQNIVLQNETRAVSSESYYDYSLVGDRGQNGQSSAEFFDDATNVLFYTQVNKDAGMQKNHIIQMHKDLSIPIQMLSFFQMI